MKFKKYIAKGLALGIIVSNLPMHSFANYTENKYYNEISQIKTKEDLQKSAQQAMRSGEVDTWIEGLADMPTSRAELTSAVVDGKIYCIGGVGDSSRLNTVEVYDPVADSWEEKAPMTTNRSGLTSTVVDGKIYCIGGYANRNYLKTVEVYDPKTNTWETKTNIPTARGYLTSAVVDGKIYCIGGQINSSSRLNTVEVYDPKTDTWETKANMPTSRHNLTSAVVDGKIYCIGGWNGSSYSNTVEVYDPKTNTWETKTSMPTSRGYLTSAVVDGKIYCIGGSGSSFYLNKVEAYIAKMSPEDEAKDAVSNAEITRNPEDIENARDLVNKLEESELKNNLQDRLNAIVPNLSLTPQSVTSNLDIYIKSENMLSLSLDTNSVTFEDFSGVEDLEKENAVTLTINSSLPYEINSYLVSEMKNANNSETMDKSILNIKANSGSVYGSFTDLVTPIKLFDNQVAGNNKVHGIDLKLKGNIAHKADVYKTTIKFEVNQK